MMHQGHITSDTTSIRNGVGLWAVEGADGRSCVFMWGSFCAAAEGSAFGASGVRQYPWRCGGERALFGAAKIGRGGAKFHRRRAKSLEVENGCRDRSIKNRAGRGLRGLVDLHFGLGQKSSQPTAAGRADEEESSAKKSSSDSWNSLCAAGAGAGEADWTGAIVRSLPVLKTET